MEMPAQSAEFSRTGLPQQQEHAAKLRPRYAGLKLLAILAAGFFLLIVAGTWSVEYMFTMSASLLALPLVSLIICRIWMRGLKCERAEVAPMVEGESREIVVDLRQPYFTDLTAHLWDTLPPLVQSDPEMPVVVDVTGTSCRFTYLLNPKKRGVYRIGPLRAGVHDPLGLLGAVRSYGEAADLIVYPKPLELTPLMLHGHNGLTSANAQAAIRAVTPGGTEFHGTRKYYPGDDLRRVHWKSAARARELIVMEFEDEPEIGDVVIAIDTQKGADVGSGPVTTLDCAARVAAYVADVVLRRGGRVSLITGSGQVTEAEDFSRLPVVLEELARVQADSDQSLAGALASLGWVAPGTAVALISSRTDQYLRQAARELLQRGVTVAQVYIAPGSFGQEEASAGGVEWPIHPDIPCWRMTYGDLNEQ